MSALKKEPELSAEDKARKAFESKTNNPARDAGLDPNFLFARHKANLASQLAKQGVTVEEAKANPEQAFLLLISLENIWAANENLTVAVIAAFNYQP